jgi:hypothetical protein
VLKKQETQIAQIIYQEKNGNVLEINLKNNYKNMACKPKKPKPKY